MKDYIGFLYTIALAILVPINILSEKMWVRILALLGIVLITSWCLLYDTDEEYNNNFERVKKD